MGFDHLKKRFRKFAIDVAVLINKLPRNTVNNAYCNQLIRSSSSSAANYRAACRAKSTADFINKLKIVEEELDESDLFLDLLNHFNSTLNSEFGPLMIECSELLAIVVQSIKTSRNKKQNEK